MTTGNPRIVLLSDTVEQREYLDAYCVALFHLSTLVLLESPLFIIIPMGFL